MLYLVEYNRKAGKIVEIQSFAEVRRQEAAEARLALEIALAREGVEHEVVLLEAASEEALRRTHRRYFEDLRRSLANLARG